MSLVPDDVLIEKACELVMLARGHTMTSMVPPVYAPNTIAEARSLVADLKSGLPLGAFQLARRQGEHGEARILHGGEQVFAGVDLAALLEWRPYKSRLEG